MGADENSSYAPQLVSVVHEDDSAEEPAIEEPADDGQTDEEPKEPPPVVDENGVVHLTRTTTKGG